MSTTSSLRHSTARPRSPVFTSVDDGLSCATRRLQTAVGRIAQSCLEPIDGLPRRVGAILQAAGELVRLPAALPEPAGGYTRHVLYSDPKGRFTVVAIVWQPGQFSPIHAHYTWCAYHVVSGELTERHYRWNGEAAIAEQTGSIMRRPGDVSAGHAGLEQIHSLGNASDRPAVSVHVYGVDGDRIATHVNRVLPGDSFG